MPIHHIHPEHHADEERDALLGTLYRTCLHEIRSAEPTDSRPWRAAPPPHSVR